MSKRLPSKREIRKGRGVRVDRKRLKRSQRSQAYELSKFLRIPLEDAIFLMI